MASLLARVLASFAAAAPVSSLDPLDGEFNQYVGGSGVFNGGSTDKKLLTRASDAADPPYDLDQLGAGPLARWKQNGVERARINNDGSALLQALQLLGPIRDSNGNELLGFTSVAAAVNFLRILNRETGNPPRIEAAGDDPDVSIEIIPKGNGSIALMPSGTGVVFIDTAVAPTLQLSGQVPTIRLTDTNQSVEHQILTAVGALAFRNQTAGVNTAQVDPSTHVWSFNQIPVGPAADPTTPNQLTRKAYVDGKKTAFSATFFAADPTVLPTDSPDTGIGLYICPDGTNVTITKIKINFRSGSHTSGGVVTFSLFHRTAASSWASGSVIGSITLNNTNNTIHVVYTNDIGDVVLAQGDTVECFLDDRSGTVTERQISIFLVGTQQVF